MAAPFTTVNVSGFNQLNTSANFRALDPKDVTIAHNMVWDGDRLKSRYGSSRFKISTQWTGFRPLRFGDFKRRDDTTYKVVVALNNGKLFYIDSGNANFGTDTTTWTEILSTTGSSPALNATLTVASMKGFNDKLFIVDGTNNIYYWDGVSANLTAVTKPAAMSTNGAVAVHEKSYRLAVLDDGGFSHLSVINDGTNMTGAGSGFLNYGRVDGTKATTMTPFADDLIISTEAPVTLKYQTYRLQGFQFYDAALIGTDRGQFEVRKVNSIAGIIGLSGQEIADDTIGLTPRGFIGIASALNGAGFQERDYLSYPIKELVRQVNYASTNKINSVVDYVNGRYLCAVPYGSGAAESNLILVYDFLRSRPAENIYRWTTWSFYFGDIACLGSIAGVPFVADTDGNIYKLNDTNAGFADNSQSIDYILRTSCIGGSNVESEKEFANLNVLFTDLNTDLDISVIPRIEGIYQREFADEEPIPSLRVEPVEGETLYDTGLLYDDSNFYDSALSDQRVVTLTNKGGRAESMQWFFNTNTTGVSWGIGGFSVDLRIVGTAENAGVNISGSF